MPVERDEYEKLRESRRILHLRQFERQFKQLAQAEVPTARLTGSQEWDWFLRILQAKREETEADLEALNHQLNTSPNLTAEFLAQAQGARLKLYQRIETLKEVMDLPAVIRGDADAARKVLEDLKRAESNGKSGPLPAA